MLNELTRSIDLIATQTKSNLPALAVILAIPCLVFLYSRIQPGVLRFGIIPRHWIGLRGIFFCPLLHADFNHLFFNCIPLIVLSNFLLIEGLEIYFILSFSIICLSGLAIWCFAKPGIHVGASALITGYWGFLVANIYQSPGITNLILGLLSLYYFAAIFFGIFPSQKGVSWEGHLFGLLSGLVLSFYLADIITFIGS